MKKVIFFALSVLVMTSCVSKKQYQEAVDARNAAEAKYNEQSLSLRECETNNKNYTLTDVNINLSAQCQIINGSFKCKDLEFSITGQLFPNVTYAPF